MAGQEPAHRPLAGSALPSGDLILDTANEAFVSIDEASLVTAWNPEAERTFGWSRAEVLGRPLTELIVPERFREDHLRGLTRFLETGEGPVLNQRVELAALHRDGRELPIEITISALEIDGAWSFNAFIRDISERRRADQYRAAQLALAQVLAEGEPLGAALPRLLEALGTSMGWQLGELWMYDEVVNVLRREAAWHAEALSAPEFERVSAATTFAPGIGLPGRVYATGTPAWITDVAVAENFPRFPEARRDGLHGAIGVPILVDGAVRGAIEFFSRELRAPDEQQVEMLITIGAQVGQFIRRKEAEESLLHHALHDPLSGLPNRALFMDRLEVAMARRSTQVAVLYLDLDRFRFVNDSLGHPAGDELLGTVAARLRETVRPSDTVARFGGDEFAVACDDIPDRQAATAVAERALLALSAPVLLDGYEHYPKASVGVAVSANVDDSPAALVAHADTAMYRAKARGGGRYAFYDRASGVTAAERLVTESLLRRGIEDGAIVVHYQPEFDLAAGRITAFEALARWQHPERGLVGPGEFVAVAEESGLIIELGAEVLRQACAQARAWHEAGAEVQVAVNISPREFTQADLAADVAQALETAGIPAASLCLEITESTVMETDDAERVLRRLCAIGVAIAIDDFGVGYSSLSRLKALPPIDYLKIDRSFVEGLGGPTHDKDAAIVATLVRLSQTLGLRSIGEGVETSEQADILRRLGCPLAQGFWLGRPQPAAAFDLTRITPAPGRR